MNSLSKLYYLIIFFIFPSVCFAQALFDWEQLTSPTTQLLSKLYFVDNNIGWVEGEGGIIINTTDGGNSWNTLYDEEDIFFLDIFFLNENRGWGLFWDLNPPYNTKILKTINGGLEWEVEDCPGENTYFTSVYFLDSLTGFLAGSHIYKTVDGGEDWIEVTVFDVDTLPPNFATLPLKRMDFYNNQIGYACGGKIDLAGVMWWTTDGGDIWAAKGLGPDPINDIYIFDSLNVIGLGGDPEGFFGIGQVNTTDGGANWNYLELNTVGVVNALSFRTPTEGWAVKNDKFMLTLNGGEEWIEFNTPGNVLLKDLVFTDSLTGYAVGGDGTILKYITSITRAGDSLNKNALNNFTLSRNYPNPFNPNTSISYELPVGGIVTIKVYDLLGSEVATLVEEYKAAGRYEVEFRATALTSGVYFYQLNAGDFVETKKMVLMK